MNNQLIIESPLFFTGYGNAGWNIAYELRDKVDVCLYPILSTADKQNPKYGSHLPKEQYEWLKNSINKTFDKEAKCLKIWHQFDLASRTGTGEYIAFPFFELDKFNKKELFHLEIPHKLIVSCEWAKQILLDNNVSTPIGIVNLGVDTNIFNPALCKTKEDDEPFIFMNVGKWEVRKGHDILLEIFESTFNEDDNVQLWLAASSAPTCFTQEEIDQWHGYYGSSKLKNKIKIIPRLETQEELAGFMAKADCGIFPSRAEGWNLDMLEMMSLNKSIIATNYSAHTEFCNKDNAFLIDILDVEPANDGKWFFGQGNWAKIDDKQKNEIGEAMRHVFSHKIRQNPAGIETARKLSWKNSSEQCVRCIYN